MKIIEHKFVEFIPAQEDLIDGVVYVSIEYDTAVHNCMCGCGEQVVTPLSPTDWKIIYNGECITLHPSIGNWDFECKSHYWIRDGKLIWAGAWNEQKVQSGRNEDQQLKEQYYEQKQHKKKVSFFQKLKEFCLRLFEF